MEFATQRELLLYLGKNPDDRSLVQRMIARGEVVKEDGMYVYSPKISTKELYKLVDELRGKIKELESEPKQSDATVQESSDDVESIKKELDDYKKWLDEANKAYEELEKEMDVKINYITKRCYNYMLQRKCLPTQTKQEFFLLD